MCADVSAPETLACELRALADATGEYPHAAQRLLVLNRDSRPQVSAPEVEILPADEWLLSID